MKFQSLSLYISLRYTRAKRRNRFISFISLTSMVGIALGVAVLITVLSVMNGFDQQIREKIFTMVPHMTVTGLSGTLTDWQGLDKKVLQVPKVKGSAPFVMSQGLLTKNNLVRPVVTMGILPKREDQVSVLSQKMMEGSLQVLKPGQFNVVLGVNLADALGVGVGDKVNLIIPQANVTPIGVTPRFKRFKVAGIFKVGTGFGFDDNYVFMAMHDAQTLYVMGDKISGLQLKVNDLFDVSAMTLQLEKLLKWKYDVSNWTARYGAFYHAVQMEKTIMFFILLLLIAIALFNLVSGLVMLVNDKRADIAILRTFGATPSLIMRIFMMQGCLVGLIGLLLGLVFGIILSLNITAFVNFIQNTFHVQLLTSGVYFVDYLPSKLQFWDLIHVGVVAFLMSLIATIYPSWKASRTKPVEALRYE